MVISAEGLPPIVALAKAGDSVAWESLIERYRLPVYVYIFEMTRDEQASLDLVQETLISAVRHIGSLREEAKFPSWLFGIAHQKCIQLWRKHTRQEELIETLPEELDEVEDPRKLLIRQEQEAEFMKLVNQLPPPQRSVLLLYFVEDFSIIQIAEITGASVGTVKSRLHYAKKAFKDLWEERVS